MSAFNGHLLGARKLRVLNRRLGTNFDRASRVTSHAGVGRQIIAGRCVHFAFDWDTGEVWIDGDTRHWWSCPRDEGGNILTLKLPSIRLTPKDPK